MTLLPSSGADPQDFYYLNYSMPGSYSRRMYEERICSPLWPVFGCKTAPMLIGDQYVPDMTSMPAGNPFEPSDFTKDTNPFYWDWETIYGQYFKGEGESENLGQAWKNTSIWFRGGIALIGAGLVSGVIWGIGPFGDLKVWR